MAAVLGVVLYRMSVLTALSFHGHSMVTSYAILFTTATAASINLCCIILFNWVYVWLAEYLTEVKFHENLFKYLLFKYDRHVSLSVCDFNNFND